MIIETTIYIHSSVLRMLNRGAALTGKSRTVIIKLLIQRMMSCTKTMTKSFSRVQYQERDREGNWNRLHILLNEYEYEYCLDMRKFYKRSVSLILADAARRYLNELLCMLLNRDDFTDNYRYRNYIFIKNTLDGTICWQIYWGVPHKLPGLLIM